MTPLTGSWSPWFAWYPVRLDAGGWRWLQIVERRASAWFVEYQEPVARCPYCNEERNRTACIEQKMAIGVLPACACGPRNDAPESEKRPFYAWLASPVNTQSPSGDSQ